MGVDSSSDFVVVTITNGVPGLPKPVPGVVNLLGVACSSATVCQAVGQAPVNQAVVVPCVPNTISGSLMLKDNHHGVVAIGNNVAKGVVNMGTGAFPGDTVPVVSGNSPSA